MTPYPFVFYAAPVAVSVALWGSPAPQLPSSPMWAFNRAEQGRQPLPGSNQNPVERGTESWLTKSLLRCL